MEPIIEDKEFGLFTGKDMYTVYEDTEPIIEHFIETEDFICISSDEGVGKSILVQQWLFNITTGTPFLGLYKVPKPRNVFFLITEGSRKKFVRRLNNMKNALTVDDSKWAYFNGRSVALDTVAGMEGILAVMYKPKLKWDVLIVDSLYLAVEGELKDEGVAKRFAKHIRAICGEFRCALIITHHEMQEQYNKFGGKAIEIGKKRLYGSKFLNAFFTKNYKLKVFDGMHKLELGKDREGESMTEQEMKLIVPQHDIDSRLVFSINEADIDTSITKVKKALLELRKCLPKVLWETAKVSKSRFYQVRENMIKSGEMLIEQHGKKTYCVWPKKDELL